MTVNIGYVGLDHHHRSPYLDSIGQLDDCEVVATADPYGCTATDIGADRLAELPHYKSVEALLAEGPIDVLWLTISNRDTPSAINTALDAGVDVYSEKPGARQADDLKQIADKIRNSKETVCFSYLWRAHPVSQEIQNLAADGFFGDIRSFDLRFIASKLSARPTENHIFDQDASGGGIVQWLGIHWIDLLPWVLDDEISRVNATLTNHHDGTDIEDGAIIKLELAESKAVGALSTGYYLREGQYDTEIKVYGEQGRCTWDPMGDVFGFEDEAVVQLDSDRWFGTPVREITYDYEPAPGYGAKWGLSYFNQFLEAREGRANGPADIDDAIRVLNVVDVVYESAKTDGWVAVDHTVG